MLLVGPVLLPRSLDALISAPCVLTSHLLPLILAPAPSLPGSAWGPPHDESTLTAPCPSQTPSAAHRFVGGTLLLPETLFGLSTELQRDLWSIFGFVSNVPLWIWPHGCFSASMCCYGAGGEKGTQSPAEARRTCCFDRCVRGRLSVHLTHWPV